MFNFRKAEWFIYTSLVIGTLYCYTDYLLARYTPDTDLISLSNHESSNDLCVGACSNLKVQMCQEWASYAHDVCPTVCDTYLEVDQHYGNWSAIFECVEKASSAHEIQSCGVSCTAPVEL